MPSRGFARVDVNCDWEMNIADVNALVDSVMKGAAYHAFYSYVADMNGGEGTQLFEPGLHQQHLQEQQYELLPAGVSFQGQCHLLSNALFSIETRSRVNSSAPRAFRCAPSMK